MELQTFFEIEDIAVYAFKCHFGFFVPDFQTKLAD